jgi:tetratricopeptide (TPR) repeat protein
VILSRLEWLSQPASALLAAAAVLGRDCSFGRLCQVSGLDEQHSLNALDELLSARLILEARDQVRPYAISHDRIREVVYAQVSQARQVVFHRRALTALAGVRAASAELAHHALAAREWQLAIHHSLLAGDEALRLYEVTTAAQHYETARSLVYQSKVDVDTGTCQQLYTRLGQAYELLFQHRDALAVYEELQAQARARDSQELELAALVACCGVLSRPFDAHDVDRARVLAQEALPLARALGNQMAEAQLERVLALTFTHGDGQIEPALAHIVASATLAREAGLREPLGLALMDLGGLCLSLGQVEQAESVWGEAVELFRELENRPRLQDVLHALGMIQMGMGKFEPALAYLEQAYRANEALGSCNETYALATTRNVIHILRGAYDRVVEELPPALDMDETLIVPRLQIEIHQQLAWCYYDLGAYEQGLFHCRKAINTHDHIDPSGRFPAFSVLALLHIAQGDLCEASLALERGLENFDLQRLAFPWWWETLPISLAEAELALAQNDLSRAACCVKQLLDRVDELKLCHLKPGVLFLQARLALAKGDKESAYQALSDALALSAEMGARRDVWALCWALSQLESERGNESLAVQLKERANAEVQFIAAHAGTPRLREIFLSRPDVQRITEAA